MSNIYRQIPNINVATCIIYLLYMAVRKRTVLTFTCSSLKPDVLLALCRHHFHLLALVYMAIVFPRHRIVVDVIIVVRAPSFIVVAVISASHKRTNNFSMITAYARRLDDIAGLPVCFLGVCACEEHACLDVLCVLHKTTQP